MPGSRALRRIASTASLRFSALSTAFGGASMRTTGIRVAEAGKDQEIPARLAGNGETDGQRLVKISDGKPARVERMQVFAALPCPEA